MKCCLKYFVICNIRWVFLRGPHFSRGLSLIILRDILGLLPNNCVIIFPGQFIRNTGIRLERWQLWSVLMLRRVVSEESYHRGQRLSGRLSDSLETACFPGWGRYPGCRWASLPWSPPPAGMSVSLMALLTEGLHTYRCIPNYCLWGRRRVYKCVMLGPDKMR